MGNYGKRDKRNAEIREAAAVAKVEAAPRPRDVSEATSVRQDRVIVFCLHCGHSSETAAWLIAGRFGPVPFGMIIGQVRCLKCDQRVATVLPWWAPTPRAWAQQYEPPGADKTPVTVTPPEDPFPFHVVQLYKGEHHRTEVKSRNLDCASASFDILAALPRRDDQSFHLKNGMQLMRDSRRDFKVVATDQDNDDD